MNWLWVTEDRMVPVSICGKIELSAVHEVLEHEKDIMIMLGWCSNGGKVIDLQCRQGCLTPFETKLLECSIA